MALRFHPNPGTIVVCDYSTGFIRPEMVKRRPVVIVSPRLRNRGNLAAVVPLSTTPPNPIEAHHCEIVLERPLPKPFHSPRMWAKCDMLATVSLDRLDRLRAGRENGQRIYITPSLSADQLREIRSAILHGLGLGKLTIYNF